jgi:hypothetical protein
MEMRIAFDQAWELSTDKHPALWINSTNIIHENECCSEINYMIIMKSEVAQ